MLKMKNTFFLTLLIILKMTTTNAQSGTILMQQFPLSLWKLTE